MELRQVDTGRELEDVRAFVVPHVAALLPFMYGPVKEIGSRTLPFKNVQFAGVDCATVCRLNWKQPNCRPRASYSVPPHANFEIPITPSVVMMSVAGKCRNTGVIGTLGSCPRQGEDSIGDRDVRCWRWRLPPQAVVPVECSCSIGA